MDELKEWALKWEPLIKAFLNCVDRRTGSLLNLPFEGGYFDQPSKVMTIFTMLEGLFLEQLKAEIKTP